MSISGPRDSLLQYEPPIEINQTPNENIKTESLSHLKKVLNAPPLEKRPNTEDIINAILTPREWDSNQKHYIQYPSHSLSSRDDVARLQKLLDERLISRQARESGICPIREELHSQSFNEIIRQVTINCPERGLLLTRVRDELKMTIASYQILYNKSVVFGQKKQIESEKGKNELMDKIEEFEAKKIKLEDQKIDLINKKLYIENRIKERKIIDENKKKIDINFLIDQGDILENFLKNNNS